jgi:hypothetical protein
MMQVRKEGREKRFEERYQRMKKKITVLQELLRRTPNHPQNGR